ncbi:MAG: LamG-like jellyroll fold domain-containing protein [Candidatus Nealsonbacteria bacterium]
MSKKTFVILITITTGAGLIWWILDGFILAYNTKISTSNPHTWTDGLVGYWSFDGKYTTSTNGTRDVSNNGNWGTFNGGITPIAGISGQALYFDGADDYMNVGDVGNVRTIEFWINDANTADGVLELINNASYVSISGSAITATGFTSPAIYINGSSASASLASGWNHVVVTDTADVAAASFLIGEADTDYISGLIDEVRIYNRALSADEVKQHYDQTKRNFVVASSVPNNWWTDGLVSYWSFDGQYTTSTAGTRGVSTSTNKWGTFNNGITMTGGISGQAIYCDGVDDDSSNVTIPATGMTTVNGTISFWFNTKTTSGIGKYIFGGIGASIQRIYFYIPVSTTVINFALSNPEQSIGRYTIKANEWYHIAGTWNGTHAALYVNGEVASTSDFTGLLSVPTTMNVCIDSASSGAYTGSVDEVRLYNRKLSADEIMMQYRQTRRNLGI